MDGVAAVAWGSGRIDLFWRGEEGDLVHQAWTGSAWEPTESLGGDLASTPAVTAWAVDRLEVFAPGRDGRLWHRWWDGARWVDWDQLER